MDQALNPVHSSADAPVGASWVVAYVLAYFGLWMALLTPPVVTLALRVAELDAAHKASHLAWILGLGAAVAMLTNPIAGMLSDRTTSRLGMRRPWIIGGMALGLVGLYLITAGGMPLVALGWCITQLGFNAALASMLAIFADQVPERLRGRVSGLLGMSLPVGVVCGVGLTRLADGHVLTMFMLPGAIAALLVTLLLLLLKDRTLQPAQRPSLKLRGFVKGFWISPRQAPDFCWAFASRFLVMIGKATLTTYQVYFLIDRMHFSAAQIPAAMLTSTLVSSLGAVIGSLGSGYLSDYVGRRKIFVLLAALVFAGGMALISLASGFNAFLLGVAVCGVALGVYLAVDLALVAQVLPNKTDAAKDLGIFNLASALPQSIAPAIAPIFLAIGAGQQPGGNYAALFAAAAAFAVVGALAILPVRSVR